MKILLIADVHNKKNGSKTTLARLKKAVGCCGCDMIVFLGDIVHGPDAPPDYRACLREVIDITGGMPFATVFGNHDSECDIKKEQILSYLSEYPNCLTRAGDYVIEIGGETLAFVDSGAYFDGEGSFYDTVKEEQISALEEKLSGKKAILFQHIIVPDIMDLIDVYTRPVIGAVRDGGKYYRFKKNVEYRGRLGECPCPPDINTGELERLAPYLKAMCFGHDHKNTFELTYKGVKFIQCGGCGGNSYDRLSPSTLKILDTATLETQIVHLRRPLLTF